MIASVSTNVPCVATGLLDDDLAVALEDVRLDLAVLCRESATASDCSPERIRARVSRTQTGHSESVVRGNPSGGFERSCVFGSGAGDHFGMERPGLDPPIDRLEQRPRDPGAADERPLDRLPHVHVLSFCQRSTLLDGSEWTSLRPAGSRISDARYSTDAQRRPARYSTARHGFRAPRRVAGARSVLPRGVQRNRVDDDDATRNLVRRQPRRTELPDVHERRRPAAPGRGVTTATTCWPRCPSAARDHAHVEHRRARAEHGLDLVGLHLAAGDVDERRHAPGQRQPPVVAQAAVVARQEPAAVEVGRVAADVAVSDRRALARARVRCRPAARPPRGARATRPTSGPADGQPLVDGVAVVVADAARFGRAVERVDLDAETARGRPAASPAPARAPAETSSRSPRGHAAASPCASRCSNMNGTPGRHRAPNRRASAASCCGMNESRSTMRRALQQQRHDDHAEAVRVRPAGWPPVACRRHRSPSSSGSAGRRRPAATRWCASPAGGPLEPDVSFSIATPGYADGGTAHRVNTRSGPSTMTSRRVGHGRSGGDQRRGAETRAQALDLRRRGARVHGHQRQVEDAAGQEERHELGPVADRADDEVAGDRVRALVNARDAVLMSATRCRRPSSLARARAARSADGEGCPSRFWRSARRSRSLGPAIIL